MANPLKRYADDVWSEAERQEFINWIAVSPEAGDIIRNSELRPCHWYGWRGQVRRPLRSRSVVAVPVVRVGEVRVVVVQGLVAMPVRMRCALRQRLVVSVLVVQVVLVLVLVFQRAMRVLMQVALAQVQPNADGHQRPGNQQRRGH